MEWLEIKIMANYNNGYFSYWKQVQVASIWQVFFSLLETSGKWGIRESWFKMRGVDMESISWFRLKQRQSWESKEKQLEGTVLVVV